MITACKKPRNHQFAGTRPRTSSDVPSRSGGAPPALGLDRKSPATTGKSGPGTTSGRLQHQECVECMSGCLESGLRDVDPGRRGYRSVFGSHGRLVPVVDRGQIATARSTTADGPVVRARADITEHGCSVIASEYARVNLRCFINHSASSSRGSPRTLTDGGHGCSPTHSCATTPSEHTATAAPFVAGLVGRQAGVSSARCRDRTITLSPTQAPA
jgi:hypothetical protein